MTVEEDFRKAAKTKSVHFVSMQVTEDGGNEPHAEPTAHEKSPEKQGFASDREKPRRLPMEDNGREHSAVSSGESGRTKPSVPFPSQTSQKRLVDMLKAEGFTVDQLQALSRCLDRAGLTIAPATALRPLRD